MKQFDWAAVAMGIAFCGGTLTLADEPIVRTPPDYVHISVPAAKARDEWLLGLVDDGLAFYGRRPGADDNAKLPSFPSDNGLIRATFKLFKDNDTLQIDVSDHQLKASQTLAERKNWYMTATYAEMGGDVSFTKDKGKYSNWKFVPTGKHSGEVTYYYIQNVNDLGKEAWLTMGPAKTRYKGGIEARKARVSFNEKQEFGVEDAQSGK